MKYLKKRDGSIVLFESDKIRNAMSKAFVACMIISGIDMLDEYTDAVCKKLGETGKDTIDIEDVQNEVERVLIGAGQYKVAKEYITYRYTRALVRKQNTTDDTILSLVNGTNKELEGENANKSPILNSTQRDYIAGEISRDMSRRILLPPHIRKAHDEGVLHFHDMDFFLQKMFNCCLVNVRDMLDNGTVMNDKLIEMPKGFQVACTVMTQIIACIASNQYGGQSVDISALGKYLRRSKEKFVRKLAEECPDMPEEMQKRVVDMQLQTELASGIQTIQYQVNTLFCNNGQSPFITLFLYLNEDDPYIEENAMIIEEILRQRIQGIKNDQGVYITPAFPKLVYVLDENNCLKGGKYDYITELAVECSAKRMYPDYISAKKMRENYKNNVFSPMGCRSFLAPWKDKNGKYKFEGRFNQGVVSINLPQIGLIAKGDEGKFWSLLDERLNLCFEALMVRHNALKKVTSDVSPLHWQYGAIARLPKHTSIEPLLYGGYSSISLGYIGLYEVTKAMKGVSHTAPEGKEFAMRVMKRLRKACDDWKAQTNIGFALYATPAESLCYRFARIDRAKFGDVEDITDKGYYTNSYHVDVREHIDAFSKLKFENEFQPISSGGCISYVEVPNMQHNLEALRTLVKFIYDNIQYAEFNSKSDYCHVCGFDGEIQINEMGEWECPVCHNKDRDKMNVVRRTCGYLGEKFWNAGKTQEIKSRVTHV